MQKVRVGVEDIKTHFNYLFGLLQQLGGVLMPDNNLNFCLLLEVICLMHCSTDYLQLATCRITIDNYNAYCYDKIL